MLVDMITTGEDLHTEPAHVRATPEGVSLIIVPDHHSHRIQWMWRQPRSSLWEPCTLGRASCPLPRSAIPGEESQTSELLLAGSLVFSRMKRNSFRNTRVIQRHILFTGLFNFDIANEYFKIRSYKPASTT